MIRSRRFSQQTGIKDIIQQANNSVIHSFIHSFVHSH